MTYDAIIIGGGLSGLAAANVLEQAGVNYLLIEASDRPGGRMKTDMLDGFLLDRGFHVFLTAYPELKGFVDCDALDLCPFYKGALIWDGKSFEKVADPASHPLDTVKTINNSIGSLKDKLLVAKLREEMIFQRENFYREAPEKSTQAYLESYGFSQSMIQQFFRPFFGGIFLEDQLVTSSRVFQFLFRVFALGQATLPAAGIEAVPAQLAKKIPPAKLKLNTKVQTLDLPTVALDSGERLSARHVIVATDGHDAQALLSEQQSPPFNQTTCLYFTSDEPPVQEPILILNGRDTKLINHMAVPNLVAPSYAPAGKHLISVSTLAATEDIATLLPLVRSELNDIFGPVVQTWEFLRHYAISRAVPRVSHFKPSAKPESARVAEGIYHCGDYLETPSVNGALASGCKAAQAVLDCLKVPFLMA